MKKIALVGGGSGGHIVPLKPIVKELESKFDQIVFYCDKQNANLAKRVFAETSVEIVPILSGKLRRYNHFSWWHYFRYPSIIFHNLVDGFKIIFAHIQVYYLLTKNRPDVIFAKGGYPCLPFGFISKIKNIPLIIHDSDVVAGLTNRVLSKNAKKITTGMPVDNYNYPVEKTIFTGIPLSNNLEFLSQKQQSELKQELGFDKNKTLIFVTGGGLGSNFINDLTIKLSQNSEYQFVLSAGKRDYDRIKNKSSSNLKIYDFIDDFNQFLMAADVVISRGGATTIAALAMAQKSTILIPNHKLTGDHQTKNAKVLVKKEAAIMISDEQATIKNLQKAIKELIKNPKYSQNIKYFSKPNAAKGLAKIIVNVSKGCDE